jgi:uncharacterized protein YndB with AHSA1/START domain
MKVEVGVLIDAPLERVWAALSDLASHATWMADAESVRFRSDQRQGPGTVIEVLTRVGPLTVSDVMEVIEWTPSRRIVVRHRGRVVGRGEFRLDPVGGGVWVSWLEDLRFPWGWGGPLVGWLARPILRLVFKGDLKRLRLQLEEN